MTPADDTSLTAARALEAQAFDLFTQARLAVNALGGDAAKAAGCTPEDWAALRDAKETRRQAWGLYQSAVRRRKAAQGAILLAEKLAREQARARERAIREACGGHRLPRVANLTQAKQREWERRQTCERLRGEWLRLKNLFGYEIKDMEPQVLKGDNWSQHFGDTGGFGLCPGKEVCRGHH